MTEQSHAPHAMLSLPRALTIEGAIDYPGPLTISGTVDGDVTCASLIVTERGVVNGSVKAHSVVVMGEVNGEIFAEKLTLKTACTVTGDIFHKHLTLEDGCFFEGRSRRSGAPLLIS